MSPGRSPDRGSGGGLAVASREHPKLGARVLSLTGSATYREAPELREKLLDAMGEAQRGTLVVDLQGVEKMDTAAMAVLVEGLLAAQEKGGPDVYFCAPSESVRKVFRLAGLSHALDRCRSCLAEVEAALRTEAP